MLSIEGLFSSDPSQQTPARKPLWSISCAIPLATHLIQSLFTSNASSSAKVGSATRQDSEPVGSSTAVARHVVVGEQLSTPAST
jgi:hypothetical protein